MRIAGVRRSVCILPFRIGLAGVTDHSSGTRESAPLMSNIRGGGSMPKTWWGKTIFWLVLLVLIPAIWRVLSGQTQRMKEASLMNDAYQSCMDTAEKEYAAAISSNDAARLSLFTDKYGVEGHSDNRTWSDVFRYTDEFCGYISRKRH